MEKVVTETDGKKLIISTENCDFIKLSIHGNSPHYLDNYKIINISKRQASKLIVELQKIVDNKQPIPKDIILNN